MDGTLTTIQIAEKFGISKMTVYSIQRNERDKGNHPIILRTPNGKKKTDRPLRVKTISHEFIAGGGIIQLVASLDRPIQDWLIAQVPKDGTMSDLLRGLIIDAYTDENQPDLG